MNKIREHLLSVLILFALLAGGCAPYQPAPPSLLDGQILELGVSATARGLRLALSGAPHTHIITDGRLIFALWPQSGGWGGACLNCAVADPIGHFRYLTGGKGMLMTWRTAEELVNWLIQEHGWTSIPASVVAQSQAILSSMANSITGFVILIVPALPTEAQS